MRKALIVATATAFLGSTLAPTPASAVFFMLPLFVGAKVDPNWSKKSDPPKKVAKAKVKKSKKKM